MCYVIAWLYQGHRVVANQRSEAMKRMRRNYGVTFKAQVALASVKGEKTLAEQFSDLPGGHAT